MLLATVIFWLGRNKMVHIQPAGLGFLRELKSREGLGVLRRVWTVYVFTMIFWALWDQSSGGEWTIQCQKLDLHFLGVTFLPEQVQVVNGILILAFIPLFNYLIYPAVSRIISASLPSSCSRHLSSTFSCLATIASKPIYRARSRSPMNARPSPSSPAALQRKIEMKTAALVVGLSLSLAIVTVNANPKDDEFEKIAKDYAENYLSSHPEFATELGDHRFDGVLTDYSSEARARMLANAKQVREALKKFDDYKQLTGANQVDVRNLRDNVESEIFRLEELREADWNPLVYNQSLANSLYLLVARDFDSAQKRIPNLRQRMDGIPNVIKQAEANLQDPPRLHTETAIEQIQGAINLVRNVLGPLP